MGLLSEASEFKTDYVDKIAKNMFEGLLGTLGVTKPPVPVGAGGATPMPDYTTDPRARGLHAVEKTIDRVSEILGPGIMTKDAKELLSITSTMESWQGFHPDTHTRKKVEGGTVGHGGMWQMTPKTFWEILHRAKRNSDSSTARAIERIQDKTGIDFMSMHRDQESSKKLNQDEINEINEFLAVPLHSALAARLEYMSVPDPIPKSTGGKIRYYEDEYHKLPVSFPKKVYNQLRGRGLFDAF